MNLGLRRVQNGTHMNKERFPSNTSLVCGRRINIVFSFFGLTWVLLLGLTSIAREWYILHCQQICMVSVSLWMPEEI